MDADVLQFHENKYKNILNNCDEKKLWSEINWSGGQKVFATQHMPTQVIADYFEQLYQPLDIKGNNKMLDLHTDMYDQ